MYEKQIERIDNTTYLATHFLSSLAYLSESSIASIVLLMAVVPEAIGVSIGMGWAFGLASAAVSLATVKLALNDKGTSVTFPLLGKRRVYFWWIAYAINIAASVFMVAMSGAMVYLAGIAVSFCGGVASDKIAKTMKVESIARLKSLTQQRVETQKLRNRLDELELNHEQRIERKKIEHGKKWSVIATEPKPEAIEAKPMENDMAATVPDGGHSGNAIVTVDTLAKNREAAKATRQRKIQERRDAIRVMLEKDPELTNKQIAAQVGVGARTVGSDRKAMGI